jgi:hypothetical protein
VNFRLDEVSCLRELDHAYIDSILDRRIHYREITQQRSIKSTILTRRWRDITAETRQNLHALAEILLTSRDDFKLVTSVETAYVYTNSAELLAQIDALSFLRWLQYTRAEINRPANTIRLRRSNYAHRAYFRILKLTETEKQQLANFFANQQAAVRISPSMTAWFTEPYVRTQDYFFVDYTGEAWLTMLALIRPGLIRKTVDIVTD